ncbi:MAG: hypothetical protein RSC90_05800 [Clostridia bacterium]
MFLMDTSNLLGGMDGVVKDVQTAMDPATLANLKLSAVASMVVLGVIVALYIVQALLAGGLARSKGYSFFGNFMLGLLMGPLALIYEAGRPVSYERECVMQDRLAMQTAKELYKLQRAREKAQAGVLPRPRNDRPMSD